MDVSKEMIKERFDKYNKLYFNGKLGKCSFYLLPKNRTVYGRFMMKKKSNGDEFATIWVANNVDWTENELREVIVHEMIHMYNITVQKIKWPFYGLDGHGIVFKWQSWRIRHKYGFKIPLHSKFKYKNKKLEPSKLARVLSAIFGW